MGMKRFVCKVCVDIDLCEECYGNYEIDELLSQGPEQCQAHPFLGVSEEASVGGSSLESFLTQWLARR